MAEDLLEQLARTEVPPVPADFDRNVHHRVNQVLFGLHLLEFGLRASAYAARHFLAAIAGWIVLTFTGRIDVDPRGRHRKTN